MHHEVYRRLWIDRYGHLDQSEAYDISWLVREYGPRYKRNEMFLPRPLHRFCIESEWILLYVAFCIIMAISRQKEEARSRDYPLLLFRKVLYNAPYHRHHCRLQAFEQFGALFVTSVTETATVTRSANAHTIHSKPYMFFKKNPAVLLPCNPRRTLLPGLHGNNTF